MIREILPLWAKLTIEEALERIEYDDKIKETFKATDFFNQVRNRNINGKSVTEIRRIYESDRGFRLRMSGVFHKSIIESPNEAPILYLLQSTEELLKEGHELQDISGILGRAYRSFASFLRDFDSRESLIKIFKERNERFSTKILQDPELDARYHADVVVECLNGDQKFRFWIWLYQATSKGIDKAIKRLEGSRGALPNGIHVLVPLNTEIVEIIEKKENRLNITLNRLEKRERELQSKKEKRNTDLNKRGRSQIRSSTILKLNAKCEIYKQQIKDIRKEMETLEEDFKKVTDIHHWLLFSDTYLQSVAGKCVKYVKNNRYPDIEYTVIQNSFLYPQRVVSSLFFFNKQIDIEKAKKYIKILIELENHIPVQKLSKMIGCTDTDICDLINHLQKNKKIEGNYINQSRFEFSSDVDVVIRELQNIVNTLQY